MDSRILLTLVLVVVIVVVVNGALLLMTRKFGGMKSWQMYGATFKTLQDPWQKENKDLEELARLTEEYKKDSDQPPKTSP